MALAQRLLPLTLLVGVLALGGASAASADSERCTSDSACAGRVTFVSAGQLFTVYDQVGDGHSAVLEYWLPDGTGPYRVWNPNGNGTSVESAVDRPADTWITYRACLGEHGPRDILEETCGATITDWV
jgi:hypothetical protein